MTRHYKNGHKPYLHTANPHIFYTNEYNQSIFSSSVQQRFAETRYSIIHFFQAPRVNRYLTIYVHWYISVLFCPENLTSIVMTRMKVRFHIQCPQSFHFVVICLQGRGTSRVWGNIQMILTMYINFIEGLNLTSSLPEDAFQY